MGVTAAVRDKTQSFHERSEMYKLVCCWRREGLNWCGVTGFFDLVCGMCILSRCVVDALYMKAAAKV